MTSNAILQIVLYMALLLGLAWPLGAYMARVYTDRPCGLDRLLGPVERLLYRLCGLDPEKEMDWKGYAVALLVFTGFSLLLLYLQQRLQAFLPLNPDGMAAVPPDLALNTATSFSTNTNWQAYGGESTMSYLTQMVGLTSHNFLSAAAGMSVLTALIRGLTRRETANLGNFWKDLTRSTLYILLPLSMILALVLVWQGMPQTFAGAATATLMEPTGYEAPVKDDAGAPVLDEAGKPKTEPARMTEQTISRGPVASQVAIKQLGTNGGGFFNVNSAHPFENPTPLTNFLEMLAILLIPASLCVTFGIMVRDRRQGLSLLAAMTLIFVVLLGACVLSEQAGNPKLAGLGLDAQASDAMLAQAGGNMEGKEVRFGITDSAIWATATTAASNGSVNSMHDSYTPLGGLVPMLLMQLGEVVYGGVGSGLYGMLVFAIVAVFVAGLMVGRTPEYLGKKIEPFEMKMASLVILIPPFLSLMGTALGVFLPGAKAAIANPGAHGFSEILYAFSSMSNNNGSAFAGLSANALFYNTAGAACMFLGRFWLAIPTLAIAGSLASKKIVPQGAGTLPTHTPLFVGLLVCVVLVVGALTFFPALALGPIAEHLDMVGR
ncbi:potassium-transporting ATPase subunit KdpA [Desulfovibrio sp. TomC]|uniref:potassium-transporting ATPase subunit KdpA n=1 Tax=Desulfovibrio sp. TomC TaxID=1562888 RepID=UPI0005734D96|nr:potassium-transporting ATPase subunit KdpA [Desulfovibrio sp. TomC]KHK02369.1 Potassium-transporting ATPase A chain [Desulfovibrio sp. TomC]